MAGAEAAMVEYGTPGGYPANGWGWNALGQQVMNSGRKVWPWALLAGIGGAVVGSIAGYAAGGLVCKLKRMVGK